MAARDLPNSGRSTQSIMDLANYLVTWSRTQHPVPALHDALAPTQILPTPAGDPQPNPPDDPAAVRLITSRFTVEEELEAVVNSLRRWLPDHADDTVAVLVPRNERGEAVANALKAAGIEYVEMLKKHPRDPRHRRRAGQRRQLPGRPGLARQTEHGLRGVAPRRPR